MVLRQMLWKFKETVDGQYFMQKISCFTEFFEEPFKFYSELLFLNFFNIEKLFKLINV
jgi:hypothetical protein